MTWTGEVGGSHRLWWMEQGAAGTHALVKKRAGAAWASGMKVVEGCVCVGWVGEWGMDSGRCWQRAGPKGMGAKSVVDLGTLRAFFGAWACATAFRCSHSG